MKHLPPRGSFFALKSSQPSAQLCTLPSASPLQALTFEAGEGRLPAPSGVIPATHVLRFPLLPPSTPAGRGWGGGRGALRASSNSYHF